MCNRSSALSGGACIAAGRCGGGIIGNAAGMGAAPVGATGAFEKGDSPGARRGEVWTPVAAVVVTARSRESTAEALKNISIEQASSRHLADITY